jgi:hypothetical protein
MLQSNEVRHGYDIYCTRHTRHIPIKEDKRRIAERLTFVTFITAILARSAGFQSPEMLRKRRIKALPYEPLSEPRKTLDQSSAAGNFKAHRTRQIAG